MRCPTNTTRLQRLINDRSLLKRTAIALCALLFLVLAGSISAEELRAVPGHVPAAVSRLSPISRLPETNHLRLVIGLPLRNQAALAALLSEIHDPSSTNYHQWLTPEQFTERFGPGEEDYQKVIGFARANGLRVNAYSSNRMLLDVEAPLTNIEKAFRVILRQYPHPTEKRRFFAPDTEPVIATNLPILHISGLDNFIVPHRLGGSLKTAPLNTNQITPYATGSSPGGYFMGSDFRNAYVPGVTNTGAGQYIAVVDVGGPYYMKDVFMYETNAGLSTNTVITNILLSGWSGIPTGASDDEGEEVLDIDMAMSMAPDAVILNYEGEAHDVFNQIAIDNKARQMTLSYGFGIDATILQIFQQFLAQGQALSQASGDGGADPDGGTGLTGVPYSTIVGGSSLATAGPNGPWQSDVVWGGSGGGISGYGIPSWQQGVSMANNQGSKAYRNYPDVAMPAIDIFTVYRNGTIVGATGGTSAASPLWAGFMALVNQEAAAQGKRPVGFPNPAIYAIGKGPYAAYANCFHDITIGNTFNSGNPSRFAACPGYDLCTGWGTPTGSNTIQALAGVGTNDFTFYAAQGRFNLVSGSSASTAVVMTRMNGLMGSAAFTISGVPPGVTATISPATTASTALLSLTTQTNTLPGSYTLTLSGTMGTLTRSISLTLVISAPVPGAQLLALSSYYNRAGIWTDGSGFNGGLDAAYSSYSANLLGSTLSWNGLVFRLGPANAADVVSCVGQTIALPAGRFNTLQLLATAVQGSQPAQTFKVTYTDNSTVAFSQGISDWASPQNYPGEFVVCSMGYRNLSDGSAQSLNVTVGGYSFTLDQTKTVKSVTLPNNSNVLLLAAGLAMDSASASLASYFNRAGIYTDGTPFTNPATGGIDGGGYAYSASVLTGSQTWSNTLFAFGPANVTNVISAAGQVIALPSGNYSALRLLATAVQGNQPSQTFFVTYSDGTSTSFSQSLSDWHTPQSYVGESKAVTMGYRTFSDGTKPGGTFYLYGYSFALNSAKQVQSFQLPGNAKVIVTAISLVPNWAPAFYFSPFAEPGTIAGQPYYATVATNAFDLNGDSLTFAKVSGPSWLTVYASGSIIGTPLSANVGVNNFVVSVADRGGLASSASFSIAVQPATPIWSTLQPSNGGLVVSWTGGIPPYDVQQTTNLAQANWFNAGSSLATNSITLPLTNSAAFFRIKGQ